ncbi:XkdF-like putative serine protease domain-containing protein [Halalkalibacterium halodurans]|uniref:XkdF-like putative serine protease domain-containing protein n=1 Tax=Halalkalibacterium halodurans TaxID=86665 RepID=UPI002E24AF5E|nr:XkdF-like putative serine protease domain-containing protein [Halalkalibacterium halodurans]MED4126316.1 XkdF-like putative serine protease domain-containing protein [Halalkalibacterium halodurans]
MSELTAPFVFKNDEKRIVYGPVLVPDEPDTDNDVVTAEKIEEVAHKFVEEYGNIDLMHTLNNVGKLVESYILPMDWQIDDQLLIPKGSWMMGVRVMDEDTWQAVKDGNLGGFSIMGIAKAAMKSAAKKAAEKRTTLADLGEDWIVNAVSLVDEPAVPKAKWVAIKSKTEVTDETVKKAVEGSLEHRRSLVRERVEQVFETMDHFTIIHSTMDDSVIFKLIDDKDQRKYFQIGYAIDDQGNVTFTTDPQEVKIEEHVVPVNSEPTPALNSEKEKDKGGLIDKLKKAFGMGESAQKAGRSISDSNFKKLKVAKEVIDDLISVGEKERAQKSAKKGEDDMDEQKVKGLIEKELQPVHDAINDLTQTIKSLGSDGGKRDEEKQGQDGSDQTETDDQDTNPSSSEKSQGEDEEKDYKALYENLTKELEKKSQPFSKRLAGQDGAIEKNKEVTSDRNPFGFKK